MFKETKMVANKSFSTVDLNKPIVFQVGHLGEAYDEWVHKPIISTEGPRFFANAFAEYLTRTPWWVVPLVWLPAATWFVSMSSRMGLADRPYQLALTVVGGILIWTLLEYLLHRYLFHMRTTSYWGNTIHYVLHGFHHKHPMDAMRLVFPPAFATAFSVPIWLGCRAVLPPPVAPALCAGLALGYTAYDLTHYYLHRGKPSTKMTQNLKRHHLNHHFRIQTKGFGVTSSLWDYVFGTLPGTKAPEKNQ